MRTNFTEIISQAKEHYWPYPLVLVNDRPVMAGHVDAYGLMGLLNEELQQKQAEPSQ